MRSSGGQAVVVELVRRRRRAPWRRCQPIAARCAVLERLGHQHVVVHGSDVAAQRAQQRREGAGRQQHPARAHAPLRRDQLDAGRSVAQVAGRRVLEQPHAGSQRRAPQAERQLARVDERRARALPEPAVVGRGGDLGARRRARRAARDVVPEAPQQRSRLVELLEQRSGAARRSARRFARARSRCRDARGRRRARRSSRARAARASAARRRSARARCSSPWVSDAFAKPPLRPLAPNPTVSRLEHDARRAPDRRPSRGAPPRAR